MRRPIKAVGREVDMSEFGLSGIGQICVTIKDLEKATAFYRDILGLEMYGHFEEVKWAEFNAGNLTLSINDPTAFDPNASAQSGGASVAFSVDNVEETIAELEGKGVKVTIPTNETPVCHFACVSDPDGNTVWFHSRKDGTFGD